MAALRLFPCPWTITRTLNSWSKIIEVLQQGLNSPLTRPLRRGDLYIYIDHDSVDIGSASVAAVADATELTKRRKKGREV